MAEKICSLKKSGSSGGTTDISLVIPPQIKQNSITISGHRSYILWLRAGSVSGINGVTVSSSSATIEHLFKSTTVLSSVNAYALFLIESSTQNAISLSISGGGATEMMVIGF